MNMMRNLLLAMLCAFASSSWADHLLEIDRRNTPGRLYIDESSIMRTGDLVQFWYVLDVDKSHKAPDAHVYGNYQLKSKESYTSNAAILRVDCRDKYALHLKTVTYNKAGAHGAVIGEHNVLISDREWVKIVEGGTWETLYDYVCAA